MVKPTATNGDLFTHLQRLDHDYGLGLHIRKIKALERLII